MRREILKRLPDGPSRDLLAVHDTCTALRNDVVDDARLRPRHQVAQLAMLVSKAVNQATTPRRAVQCVPLLPLMDAEQRRRLVDVVINARHYVVTFACGACDLTLLRAEHLGDMAEGLAHLDDTLQAKLVEAIGGGTDEQRAEAVYRFGRKLAHLSETLRGNLVDMALGLEGEEDRATAIAGLGAGLAHLNRGQQKKLLEAATDLEEWRAEAIHGLCQGLQHLGADLQQNLFTKAADLAPGWPLAMAVFHLGSSLGCLSMAQRNRLFTATLALRQDADHNEWAPEAMQGLAAGAEFLTSEQFDTLVTEWLAPLQDEDKVRTIVALARRLAHLTPEQQDKLLDAAGGLDFDCDKARAVAGFAAGLTPVNETRHVCQARKTRVVSLALGLTDNDSKAEAIAALGPRLGDLDHEQHEALVDAAIGLLKAGTVSKERSRALGAGLGVGLGSLHPDLRGALVNAVSRTLSPNEQHRHASTAQAIAGLGAGRPYLDEAQYKALIDSATRLQRRSAWAPLRKPPRDIIMSFAAEAAKALDPGARPQPAAAVHR